MNGKVYVGKKALSLTEYEKSPPISGVILWVDDNNSFKAGDESGTVIEQDCPYATQSMANSLLSALKGYEYRGLEADGAKVSPIAELGDGLTVSGIYTQLAYQNIRFSSGEVMDASAPGGDETLHEYKTEGETTKYFNHQISETRSQIIKTAEEIRLEVENEVNGLSSTLNIKIDGIEASLTDEINGLSASINLQIDSITSTVQGQGGQISQIQQTVSSINTQITGINGDISSLEQTASSLRTQISNAQGDISSLEQLVDSITLSVSNGSTSSTIQLKAGSATISSQTIQMNGLVTFTGLSSGTTTINGACIKTGLIDADRLNLTGAITFGDLSSSVQGDINEALNTANDAYDLAYDNQLPVYIKNTYIDSTQIMSPTITGGTITGGYIYGGRYYNLSGEAYLEVGGSEFGNLILRGSGNNPVFTVEDGVGGISLSTYRHTFLSVSSINGWATPSGTWDFSNANVTGLKTTAVFG